MTHFPSSPIVASVRFPFRADQAETHRQWERPMGLARFWELSSCEAPVVKACLIQGIGFDFITVSVYGHIRPNKKMNMIWLWVQIKGYVWDGKSLRLL